MVKCRYLEIDLNEINLLDKNPRKITKEKFDKLKNDIEKDTEYLKQRPPLLNLLKGKYYCYAGTQRVKAAKELGYKSIWCFVEDNVSEKVQDQRMLIDNTHSGQWDIDLLRELDFEILELQDMGIPIFDLNVDDLVDFFQKDESQEKKNKIVLEYSEEEYNKVIDAFSKYTGSKEEIIYKLLGL